MKFSHLLPLCLLLLTASCGLLGGDDDNSPDIPGKIVFSAKDNAGNYQIFTIKANGKGLKQLTKLKNGGAYQPAWSPDGAQIVFSTSLRSSSNGPSLYVMNANGSNMRALNERENSHIPSPGNNPKWSPDGSKVAFDRCVNCQIGTNYELFVYDIEADSVIRLTDNQTSESNPVWSPDGNRIAFVTDRDYVSAETQRFRTDIYMIDAKGTNLKRLTNTGFIGSFTWKSADSLFYVVPDLNTGRKDLVMYDVETGAEGTVLNSLEVSQFWIFWDSVHKNLFTINKNHQELPATLSTFDINGSLIKQFETNNPALRTGLNFDLFINKN